MVIAYHAILSMYGLRLPNDPRGSWSTWIRKWDLLRFGPPTKVETRQSVASENHDHKIRLAAKQSLAYPPVELTGQQALAISKGFAQAVNESGYRIHACAILPEHTHVILGQRVDRPIEQIVGHLKGRATQQLKREGIHPLGSFSNKNGETPSPWSEGYWKTYIESAMYMQNAIEYVNENPVKEGKRPQNWHFVEPWDVGEIDRIRNEMEEKSRGKPRR